MRVVASTFKVHCVASSLAEGYLCIYLFFFCLKSLCSAGTTSAQQRAVLDRGNKKKSGTVPSRYTKLDHKHFKTESVSQTNSSDDFFSSYSLQRDECFHQECTDGPVVT